MHPARLILASTSVYRRELLQRFGLPFDIMAPGVDESSLPGEPPESIARRLSLEKAQAVARMHPDALVIGSDQTATLDGRTVIGKPGTHERAVLQLRAASGQTMTFHSGLALCRPGHAPLLDCVLTRVKFRTLTDEEIERYLRKETPYDCAGSAKSEGLGISLLDAQEGTDPTALVGLPLIRLSAMLRDSGVSLP